MHKNTSRIALSFTTAAIFVLAGSATAHADGDGNCDDAGNICVYNAQQPTDISAGYYDLNDPHPTFHSAYWLLYNKSKTLSDSISAAANTAGTKTSCAGFTFWWDTNYGGTSYFAGRNFSYLTFYDNNDEFSSFKKTGC
ncbi:hypothetical protein [Streptomyces sp. NPDC088246]|uniref:hypothetical protein n=1 Tax=Streptomyces sp. NPDC088246 TaxID=3365842 RepID=UPI00382D8B37